MMATTSHPKSQTGSLGFHYVSNSQLLKTSPSVDGLQLITSNKIQTPGIFRKVSQKSNSFFIPKSHLFQNPTDDLYLLQAFVLSKDQRKTYFRFTIFQKN